MKSIYIHFPFCLQKCAYCDFYSQDNLDQIPAYLKALSEEIKLYSTRYKNSIMSTIYIGGGTPSLLTPAQLIALIEQLRQSFRLELQEFSLEVNPETVDAVKLEEFKQAGVNRISIGVQSFAEENLRYLGRVHNSAKAIAAVKTAKQIFKNVGLDLINNLPGQDLKSVQADLQQAIDLKPEHISCYELTFAPGTPLAQDAERKNPLDREIYLLTKNFLQENGYPQYEISNYARPGFECQHNLNYWSDVSYLGLGPAAHSYDREQQLRWSNSAELNKYIEQKFKPLVEKAHASDKLFTGLRKTSGIPAVWFKGKENILAKWLERGGLERFEDMIRFTAEGQLIADTISAELL